MKNRFQEIIELYLKTGAKNTVAKDPSWFFMYMEDLCPNVLLLYQGSLSHSISSWDYTHSDLFLKLSTCMKIGEEKNS